MLQPLQQAGSTCVFGMQQKGKVPSVFWTGSRIFNPFSKPRENPVPLATQNLSPKMPRLRGDVSSHLDHPFFFQTVLPGGKELW